MTELPSAKVGYLQNLMATVRKILETGTTQTLPVTKGKLITEMLTSGPPLPELNCSANPPG